jgi:hypothetical protein
VTELRALSAALFAPHLTTDFTLVSDEGLEITATLVACTEHPRSTMRGSLRTAFDLILQCSADGVPHFNGASFTVSHPQLETFGPVYVERILPASAGPGMAVFQIIFN